MLLLFPLMLEVLSGKWIMRVNEQENDDANTIYAIFFFLVLLQLQIVSNLILP